LRTLVIGGTGHIGSYLVPRLVALGHEVVSMSRGERVPYVENAAWRQVERLSVDRESEERGGTFAKAVLATKPDAVVDLICFTPESARTMVESLRGVVRHYLFCGTIWVHGHTVVSPTTEEAPRRPFGEYGIRKAEIERLLLDVSRREGFPATVLHPGHIVGPGWIPLNPAGNFNIEVYSRLARGERLSIPNLGMETVHHVHADDVALAFEGALANWSSAVGESFHVVSPAAVTLRGYAEAVAAWFGTEANIEFLPWVEWAKQATPQDAAATWDHIAHSPNCSGEKAQRRIGYRPRYSSFQAVFESLAWLKDAGKL
jgi:nucleoside-diphosphate-sugar epimerase